MKLFILILFAFIITASSLNDARNANDAYRSGDFETAVQLYQQAIENDPNDARLHFNLGSALAQLGQDEQSVRAFEAAKQLMEDPHQQSMADYNAGTLLSEAGMYDEAIDFFRDALRKNPNDPDAKHNYEMTLRKQQQDEQSDDNDQDEDQQQDPDQDQDEEQDQDHQNQDQQNQDEGSQDDQDPQDQDQPQPDEISQDEAENILNALEQLEREILENRKKEAEESRSSNDKDW